MKEAICKFRQFAQKIIVKYKYFHTYFDARLSRQVVPIGKKICLTNFTFLRNTECIYRVEMQEKENPNLYAKVQYKLSLIVNLPHKLSNITVSLHNCEDSRTKTLPLLTGPILSSMIQHIITLKSANTEGEPLFHTMHGYLHCFEAEIFSEYCR
jgi:hypothetical protein